MVGKGNSVVWRKLYREKNAQFWQLTSSFFFALPVQSEEGKRVVDAGHGLVLVLVKLMIGM